MAINEERLEEMQSLRERFAASSLPTVYLERREAKLILDHIDAQEAEIEKMRAFDRDLPDCKQHCPEIKQQAERIEELERTLHDTVIAWQNPRTFHRCRGRDGKITSWAKVLCSSCRGSEEEDDFDPVKRIDALEAENVQLKKERDLARSLCA